MQQQTIEAMRGRMATLTRELEECHDFESVHEVTEEMAEIANWLATNDPEGLTDNLLGDAYDMRLEMSKGVGL